ncbi:MAG: carbohydrate ABC transporter permease [Microbacterium sp.]
MSGQPTLPEAKAVRGRRRAREEEEGIPRGIFSSGDMRKPSLRFAKFALITCAIVGLLIAGLGPLLWLAKSAISSTTDIYGAPLSLWPLSGAQWSNLWVAWTKIDIGGYALNTVLIALGDVVASLIVTTTAAYVLAILRPRYGKVLNGAIMATLFIPAVISLVPLYLTVVRVPILNISLIDSWWAVWLPGAANAFYILIVKQYFESIPRELFEAARSDGCGVFRMLWSIVLPLSKPILGVLVLLAFMGSWKEFLWPLLVLPTPSRQPLSVALARISETSDQSLVIAGMFIATFIPVLVFLLFQKQFLRGAGAAGAIKG